MVAPITHFLALTAIRRARMLPSRGQVKVRVGQKVSATDVVAECFLPGKHLVFNIRRALNVSRVERAEKLIECKVGDKLQKGDVIAEAGGLLPRSVRAPANGQVVAIVGGQVMFELQSDRFELKAGLNGTVTQVMTEQGVVLEANGALLQGVWGNGQINLGLLTCLAKSPEEEFTRANVDVSMRGAVLMSGHCRQAEALVAANELPLRGLILASMSADLIPVAQAMSYPILLIEGFGRLPMNNMAYKLLTSSDKRDICLNAANDAYHGDRPEAMIPLPANGQVPQEIAPLEAGRVVRLQGPPYAGLIGKVQRIHSGLTTLPNGLRTSAADVLLENNQLVLVALGNLDVLE